MNRAPFGLTTREQAPALQKAPFTKVAPGEG